MATISPLSKSTKLDVVRREKLLAYSKAMLSPMPRDEVDRTVLFTRIGLQRLRNGERVRGLVDQIAEVVVFTTLVTKAGYGTLTPSFLKSVEDRLIDVLFDAAASAESNVAPSLLEDATVVVNEYDRLLQTTRLEVVVQAFNGLKRRVHVPGTCSCERCQKQRASARISSRTVTA
ncbi:hypothetical protein [Paraburkholderia acidisoli]|uniref:Uncharacterized protein n=1 Tax=Paraburkholderia acidisoli TaxID=2571748 RepID=A0A7Z2GML5_9BURK|nr:hypothetical protein [Paraburkholderia acidisoli]QGZ64587.1 hypothetical protein FAZ98_22355 [Paraburkholderia acidisoli]